MICQNLDIFSMNQTTSESQAMMADRVPNGDKVNMGQKSFLGP